MNKSSDMIIGETSVAPGRRALVNLPIADLYTGTSLSMQVKVVRGRRPGPTMFVCAAIHGDELNGVEIIRRLLKRRELRSLSGTLLAVPVVNVHGFLDQSRYLPDRRDLNRSFPGSSKGSIAARTAHTFVTHILSRADCGIDLHTGALNRINLPQIRANLDDPATMELAKAFGAPVILDSVMRDGSLRQAASERDVPVLVYEAGEALRFDPLSIRAGLQGVLRVMRHVEMLPEGKPGRSVKPVIADSTSWVRAPDSGIVINNVNLGTRVVSGQRLAVIGDPVGDAQLEVGAPFDGIVIGRNNLPLAHEGDALYHVAAFKRIDRAESKVEQFTAEYTESMS